MNTLRVWMLFVCAVAIGSCGSSKLATPEQMNHEYVRELPGVAKADMYSRAP